jgi:hypothetical protein
MATLRVAENIVGANNVGLQNSRSQVEENE